MTPMDSASSLAEREHEVPPAASASPLPANKVVVIFNMNNHAPIIGGDVHGGHIVGSAAPVELGERRTTGAQLGEALQQLRPLLADIAESQRAAVQDALDLMIQATHDRSVSDEAVKQASATATAASPSMAQGIRRICESLGTNLAARAIYEYVRPLFPGEP